LSRASSEQKHAIDALADGEKFAPPWFAKDEWMPLRFKWAAALLVALLALSAGFYRWPISSAFVVGETSARLSHSLGLELGHPARVRLSLLPMPTLHMIDVEVRGQDKAIVLTAPEASVRLALLPLLIGNFEFASARLGRPTILVDLDSHPFASGSAISSRIGAGSGARQPAPLGALQIRGGLLRIVSAANNIDTIVEDVEGTFDWPKLDSPLRVDWRATWRDERLAIEASLGAPADLLAGGRSDSRLSIASSNVQIKLEGDILGAENRFEGSVSADVVSASALKRVLGLPHTSSLSNGRISLAAKIAASSQMLTLSAMQLSFLEQNFEGALAFTKPSKRLAISGTLAADELNLEPILADGPALFDAKGDWSVAPFNFAPLTAFDFDLRMSAATVKWRDHPLTDAAIELLSERGRLTATLAEATAYSGLLKAEIALAPAPSGFDAHASASLTNADVGALCGDFGWRAYSGQGGGDFSLKASGDSPAALIRTLEGKATIQLGPGTVDGLSLEEALRRSERRSIDIFNDMRMGRTVLTQAAASVAIEKGGGGTLNASMAGPGVNAWLGGSLDMIARQLTTRATAAQTDEGGVPVVKGPRLDFDIAGPWSAPIVKPFVGG
jgi:AsmA protein